MRAAWLLLLLLVACGGSPAKPSPRPPVPDPPVLPAASFETVQQPLIIGELTREGWRFTAEGRNAGPGCAIRVRGIFVLHNADRSDTQRTPWSLPEDRIVARDEQFRFEGCCVRETDTERFSGYYIEYAWENVACKQPV